MKIYEKVDADEGFKKLLRDDGVRYRCNKCKKEFDFISSVYFWEYKVYCDECILKAK